jgi:hypothetical protein
MMHEEGKKNIYINIDDSAEHQRGVRQPSHARCGRRGESTDVKKKKV